MASTFSLSPTHPYATFCRFRSGPRLDVSGFSRAFSPSLPSFAKICASADEQPDAAPVSMRTPDQERDELAAKLAAAEAEAEGLKKELAARRVGNDLAKLRPATPEKRIDGTGNRETLFSGPGKDFGDSEKPPNAWGLLETELFLSKGAPTEGSSLGGIAMEDGANEIVRRRLLIGLGISVVAVGLSFLKIPAGLIKPPKPLFFYLVPILRLREQLKLIEDSSSDANSVRQKLQKAMNLADVSKDTFLSAAGWLEGDHAEKAVLLAYKIYDYLNQADYDKYFESLEPPSTAKQLEFLKFSLRAVQTARENLDLFLTLMPQEALEAAKSNSKV